MSTLQHQRLQDLCEQLKLLAVAEAYANLADTASEKGWSYLEYLEHVLKAEHARDVGQDGGVSGPQHP